MPVGGGLRRGRALREPGQPELALAGVHPGVQLARGLPRGLPLRAALGRRGDVLARLQADGSCPDALRQYVGELTDKFLLHLPSPESTTNRFSGLS